MLNPLLTNLNKLTNTEIENRIVDLQRKYFQTHNPNLQQQLITNLTIFKEELQERRMKEALRQQEQMRKDGGNDLDSLINIS
jgi:Na+-transporting NADH:ubiquinone oxidoreductase subunit NqrC